MEWFVNNYGFIGWILTTITSVMVTVATVVGIYWKIDKRMGLTDQYMKITFDNIQTEISRLEKKQTEYNNLQGRMLKAEIDLQELKNRFKKS